ncbi:MAG: class I adenylate-forming enzyme family protein, partial [Acidimicrobiales bacterium]
GVVYDGQPLDGVDLRIVDGEIQVCGPMLLRAYRDGSNPVDDEGWLATGDAGTLSDGGELSVFGRTGDLIISGGENVWPVAVERVLDSHPLVAEVMIVGRPHADWGQQVTAVVVPTDSAGPPSLDQLRDHTKQQLPAYCAPREMEVVDTLPRTPSGKLVRQTNR